MSNDNRASRLRLIDDDHGEITVTYEGKEVRGWSYSNDNERRMKMLAAREYTEGWFDGYRAGIDWSEKIMIAGLEKLSSPTSTQ